MIALISIRAESEKDRLTGGNFMSGKYMAYVGSYSYLGKAKGITVYDIDLKEGYFKKRCEVEVDNSSYVVYSHDKKFLYSIADEGVVSFRILPNGTLNRMNCAKINGMRGCHLSVSPDNKYICISGFHDGKLTVLEINKDGTVGNIKYEVYNQGYGSIAERNFSPHVRCSKITPDNKYLFSVDSGIDQVKIFRFDPHIDEELRQVDAIRCERGSSPRFFRFSPDGRFIYLIYEIKNVIEVYSYKAGERAPIIEKIQSITTTADKTGNPNIAACSIKLSDDGKYVFCSNAGENTVTMYERDEETGLLTMKRSLPISGEYPKDIALFPDGKHLVVANHVSGTLTFFKVDYDKSLFMMNKLPIEVNQPNCIRIVELI